MFGIFRLEIAELLHEPDGVFGLAGGATQAGEPGDDLGVAWALLIQTFEYLFSFYRISAELVHPDEVVRVGPHHKNGSAHPEEEGYYVVFINAHLGCVQIAGGYGQSLRLWGGGIAQGEPSGGYSILDAGYWAAPVLL